MKVNPLIAKITRPAITLVALILILMPFHAFLTVWLNSLVGHYTALRLWKEVLLVILTGVTIYILVTDAVRRRQFMASKLNRLIAAFLAVIFIWGLISYLTHHVTLKALGYGWIIDARFLLFFLVVSVLASYSDRLRRDWSKFLLWPAAIVVAFGLLQYFVLPNDFLKHFGYNDATIFPYETINHNINYIRVMSTLRGANPLGAYLVLVVSLLGALWLKRREHWKLVAGFLGIVALGLTFSRSAWIGLVLALITLILASLKTTRSRQIALGTGVIIVLVVGGAGLALRHNSAFQNTIYHTSDQSKVATSSNEGHASALKDGLRDVVHQPLGLGTGTAGPASVYNAGKVRIAENFFVQIAQETGVLGVALFIAIQLYVGRALWRKRQDPLALGLVAALVGISFVNLLSHAWADDTIAYLFWGLAAVALASQVKPVSSKKHEA
jgi:O-antigen ligase